MSDDSSHSDLRGRISLAQDAVNRAILVAAMIGGSPEVRFTETDLLMVADIDQRPVEELNGCLDEAIGAGHGFTLFVNDVAPRAAFRAAAGSPISGPNEPHHSAHPHVAILFDEDDQETMTA